MDKAVFLDRDGVINKNLPNSVKTWEEFEFLPNAFEALKILSKTDYKIIIVSNQAAVGYGKYTEETLREINQNMLSELSKHGIRIDATKYCIHKYDDGCKCRKPKPGMILDSAKELDIDLSKSWLVGDKNKDIKAANNADANIKTILVKTGFGGKEPEAPQVTPDFIAEDILDAAKIILKD